MSDQPRETPENDSKTTKVGRACQTIFNCTNIYCLLLYTLNFPPVFVDFNYYLLIESNVSTRDVNICIPELVIMSNLLEGYHRAATSPLVKF